ncbi:hypothetical protein ANCCEY_08482 [Ancylostoma ceylanicum]|uniref:Uncharacterized protein n=1 Tax=Ancylostoma ceylanicum TaxID=53326 RepID=A0A0D6LQW9_9BILA|nr:hypothetical protein ANCCEY_08482 [Ancylostoma ceylanicum]
MLIRVLMHLSGDNDNPIEHDILSQLDFFTFFVTKSFTGIHIQHICLIKHSDSMTYSKVTFMNLRRLENTIVIGIGKMNKTPHYHKRNMNNTAKFAIGNAVISRHIEGASGHVVIGENGTRNPTFYINGLASNEEAMSFAYVFVSGINATYSALYRDESRIWSSRGGIRPAAVPKCGFEGKQCPPDFVSTYLLWIIIGGAVLVICILGCVAGIIVTILNKRAEMARLNELWQIPFTSLAVLANKKEPVAAMKHEIRINFDSREAAAFRMMRQIENENVNRFIGICIDGPQMMSIWRNCSRGSINDVIMKGALMMDNFFVVSLLKDIASIFFGQLQKFFAPQSVLHLIRDCWAERPSERPPIDKVKSSLRSMNTSNYLINKAKAGGIDIR